MTIEEIKWLIEVVMKYSFGGLIAGGVVFLFVKNFATSYLNEKGKNLASKEDIARLTDLVEGVKHQYNVLIEDVKGKQQLRMAAVDQRLKSHQEAFTFWYKLVVNDHENLALIEAQQWWNCNCLYLEPQVRIAFIDVCNQVHLIAELRRSNAPAVVIQEAKSKIRTFPDILFNAIQLPVLTDNEKQAVQPLGQPQQSRKTV